MPRWLTIKSCTEVNLHGPSLLPTLQCTLQCMGHAQKCITGTQTSPISKLGVWKHTSVLNKSSESNWHHRRPCLVIWVTYGCYNNNQYLVRNISHQKVMCSTTSMGWADNQLFANLTQLRRQRLLHPDNSWSENPTIPDNGLSNHPQTGKRHDILSLFGSHWRSTQCTTHSMQYAAHTTQYAAGSRWSQTLMHGAYRTAFTASRPINSLLRWQYG